MTEINLKNELLRRCMELGVPMVGISPVDRWANPPCELPNKFKEWIPKEFWPQSIYPEAKTVVVIGYPVQLPILETAPSIYYHELYNTVNAILDIKAYEISNFLTDKGYPSIYLPRDAYGDIEVLIKKPLAFFSHKHAAYLAGLGTFGENNVLLTEEYGPRVRFTSIFTTADFEGDPIMEDELCLHCKRCVENCPVNAIENQTGDVVKPINKISCATRSKKLRKDFKSPCGICIKVCPVGKDREIFNRKDMKLYTEDVPEKYKNAWKHVQNYGSM